MAARHTLDGVIASAGFVSGDRIVVGSWRTGPLGPMNDVMWARSDNKRVLIAPSKTIANYIATIYEFDDVEIDDVFVGSSQRTFKVATSRLQMMLHLSRAIPIPFRPLRPQAVTQHLEGPIAKRLFGVHTHGVTKSGVEEWYQARRIQWVRGGSAVVDGVDVGALKDIQPLKVGVSEPPRRPSVVHVRPVLNDPQDRLNALVIAMKENT